MDLSAHRKIEWQLSSTPHECTDNLLKKAFPMSSSASPSSSTSPPRVNTTLLSALRAINNKGNRQKGKFNHVEDEEEKTEKTSKATQLWKSVDEFDSDEEIEM